MFLNLTEIIGTYMMNVFYHWCLKHLKELRLHALLLVKQVLEKHLQ